MNYDPTDLRTKELAAAEQRERQALRAQQDAEDFKALMATGAGRRFIWRVLDRCGVFRTTFRPNSEAAFLEGQRNIGLMLWAEIVEHTPEQLQQLLQEAKERNQ